MKPANTPCWCDQTLKISVSAGADAVDHRMGPDQRLRVIEGQVLRDNRTMLDMCRQLGFTIRSDPNDPDIKIVTLATEQIDVC